MQNSNGEKIRRVVIVGGGFAGVRAGLDLAKRHLPNTKITLISDKPHFEYHAALYRVVTGRSPLEVCIPLREIFGTDDRDIEIVQDSISSVDLKNKKLAGESGSHYMYDFLILALGSQTTYFNIPGLAELSYGFKSIKEALRLKKHLHELFGACEKTSPEERVCAAHIVVIGAGASGVELAGELAAYTSFLAGKHNLDRSLVTIDLVEAATRILPSFPERFSRHLARRLHELGVNVFLNRAVVKEEVESVYLKDIQMKTKTVIWTAGVEPNHLYASIPELVKDKKGRVIVGEHLEARADNKNVYVLGDAAATPFTGLAQTAIGDGEFVARQIARKISGQSEGKPYRPKKPVLAIPVGPGFAGSLIGNFALYGRFGWWLRRLADLRFFMSILPFLKAFAVWQGGRMLSETCPICIGLDENRDLRRYGLRS